MSIGGGERKLWRRGEPFPQRFTATIHEDGSAIVGRGALEVVRAAIAQAEDRQRVTELL